ncbi:MAG: hypothetical protein AUJ72_03520 [Candidatus Omnitrophica bacterium CG1_02_46_14]|nr:MAG: hypothetical protein AUJ72_03520 [Candidatus Omnitrophica bacterium CG1_02_46_14]
MKLTKNSKGFTLVEIMIVVAIIGLLAAIAVPNFVQARTTARKNACINNLRLISAAKDQAALENGWAETSVLTKTEVSAYMKQSIWPVCPSTPSTTDNYTVNAVSVNPVCALSASDDHSIG